LVVVALGLGAGVGEALLKEEGVEVGEEGERKGEVNRSEVKCWNRTKLEEGGEREISEE
jgi:hypothetical protein